MNRIAVRHADDRLQQGTATGHFFWLLWGMDIARAILWRAPRLSTAMGIDAERINPVRRRSDRGQHESVGFCGRNGRTKKILKMEARGSRRGLGRAKTSIILIQVYKNHTCKIKQASPRSCVPQDSGSPDGGRSSRPVCQLLRLLCLSSLTLSGGTQPCFATCPKR